MEAQISKYANSEKTELDNIKDSLENTLHETVNLEQQGKNIIIEFTEKDKTYKYNSLNGTVNELMKETPIYWKIDNNTVFIRATASTGYTQGAGGWVQYGSSIVKVKIEEPIAPAGSLYRVFYKMSNLLEIENMKDFHTDYVTNMGGMFADCKALTKSEYFCTN